MLNATLHVEPVHNLSLLQNGIHSTKGILQFIKTESVIIVQCDFCQHFWIDPPLPKNISRWYHQFGETRCLCNDKSPSRLHTSDESGQIIHSFSEVHKSQFTIPAANMQFLIRLSAVCYRERFTESKLFVQFLILRLMAHSSLKKIVMGMSYREMLQTWLFPQLHDDFIFQQDGFPPHWHNTQFLNCTLVKLKNRISATRVVMFNTCLKHRAVF